MKHTWDETETQERQSRNNRAAMGQGPGSSSRNAHIHICELFYRNSPQVEDLRFLFPVQAEREIPVSSPPTNQKRVTHPATLTPNFTFKKLAPKASGSSGLLSMNHLFFLLGPAINLSLLQTLTFQSAWPHCVSGILNLSWTTVPEQFIIWQVQWSRWCPSIDSKSNSVQ